MAMTPRGKTMENEVEGAYVKHQMDKFMEYRYHGAFMDEVDQPVGYEVEVTNDQIRFCKRITVRSYRGFQVELMVDLDAEQQFTATAGKDEWFMFQMQRLEPLIDSLVFTEWFYSSLSEEDRMIYRKYLNGKIKSVAYLPPRVQHGPYHRSMYGDEGRVAPDWLAVVEFENGAKRREQIRNIREDTSTWISMMLMVVDNKELRIGSYA